VKARQALKSGNGISRRSILGSCALASLSMLLQPNRADAAAPDNAIRADEYWVADGDVKLYVYRKRLRQPPAARAPMPVLFLAHGSSVSSVPSFDLKVPGASDYSMMDAFARWGFDVWTMDFEGYGKSSRTGGNSDIQRSVYDMTLSIPLIQKQTGQERLHLFGESAGALRVGCYAQAHPDHIARVVLGSLSFTGEGSPTLTKRKESLPFLSTHDRRPRDREMILSIFTRDKDGTYDPAVPVALANMELAVPGSDTVPTGSYVDMTTKLPVLDPRKATHPLLIIRGEYDGIATEKDVTDYFQQAATSERAIQVVPGATHAVGWGRQRVFAWTAMRNFLLNTPA
jgi:pimeloyl-ACP methyl ester carboxylesterase